ncbi:FHA domain-containing protein [Arthrobacter rhombi]|uniref:FHA domain-containing protein n=1 Tax=Arthrobacter rhombi TaxID=71253 RepID=UPI003F9364DC
MTMRMSYLPGPWWALVRHGHLVLLPEGTDPEHLERLWQALEKEPGVESLLSAVLSARGLALTGMAPFGIISLESDVHTILRGPVSMSAEGRELSTHVNGLGVTTWMERRIPNQESLSLALDDVLRQHDDGDQPWLPIVEGIVPFGRLRVQLPTDGPGTIEPLSAPQPETQASATATADLDVEAVAEPEAEAEMSAAEPAATELPQMPAEADEEFVSAEEADESHTVLSRATREPSPEPEAEPKDEVAQAPAEKQVAEAAPEEPRAEEPEAAERVSDDTIAGLHGEEEQPDPEALIDAVPWLAAARAQAHPEARGNQKVAAADAGAEDLPTITSAPGRPEPTPTQAPVADLEGTATPSWGDHDGNTVMRGDLPTEAIPTTSRSPGTEQPMTGPLVLGRLCAEGHANPPTSSTCGLCEATLNDDPTDVARPALGRMVISDGEIVELDRPAVIGRQPTVSRSASESMPRVVQVKSPSGDISRSHLEVRLEGWHVMLVDLKATNGTLLVRQNMPPRRLGQGEKLMLLDGDIADLGDGVSLRFEGLL